MKLKGFAIKRFSTYTRALTKKFSWQYVIIILHTFHSGRGIYELKRGIAEVTAKGV